MATNSQGTNAGASPARYLSIYLNDHGAGSVLGVELAKRIVAHHEGTPAASGLATVRDEIESDRDTLRRLMAELGVTESRVKPAGAWLLERLGRLKPNGQVRGLSPLGRFLELEGLVTGITGKLLLWRALERSLGTTRPGFDFAALASSAEDQRDRVEAFRLEAAAAAFG